MSVQVPKGYKQTEVGVIPEDWLVQPLEEFTSFISYGFTNPMPTVQSGVCMVTAKDINNGKINFDSARRTTLEAYEKLLTTKSRPKKDDILLTKDGTLGRLALVDDRVVCINQSVAVLRPNNKAYPLFLKLLLESPRYQEKMLQDAGGSTIKHIYITIVNLMPLAVPASRQEQQAIAEALSDADALIESLEQLIAKKRQIKQGAMQELLTGQRRLPGFSGEWVARPLDDLLERLSNGVVYTPTNNINGVMVTRIETISSGCIDFEKTGLARLEKNLNEYKLQSGDILFSHINSLDHIGKVAIFKKEQDLYHGMNLLLLRCGNSLDSDFLYFLLSAEFTRECIRKLARQAVSQASINTKDLKDFKVFIPEKLEQNAIASLLIELNDEVNALENKLSKARKIKQSMMQELLTGRIRLL